MEKETSFKRKKRYLEVIYARKKEFHGLVGKGGKKIGGLFFFFLPILAQKKKSVFNFPQARYV